jgi:hypothetical protein
MPCSLLFCAPPLHVHMQHQLCEQPYQDPVPALAVLPPWIPQLLIKVPILPSADLCMEYSQALLVVI